MSASNTIDQNKATIKALEFEVTRLQEKAKISTEKLQNMYPLDTKEEKNKTTTIHKELTDLVESSDDHSIISLEDYLESLKVHVVRSDPSNLFHILNDAAEHQEIRNRIHIEEKQNESIFATIKRAFVGETKPKAHADTHSLHKGWYLKVPQHRAIKQMITLREIFGKFHKTEKPKTEILTSTGLSNHLKNLLKKRQNIDTNKGTGITAVYDIPKSVHKEQQELSNYMNGKETKVSKAKSASPNDIKIDELFDLLILIDVKKDIHNLNNITQITWTKSFCHHFNLRPGELEKKRITTCTGIKAVKEEAMAKFHVINEYEIEEFSDSEYTNTKERENNEKKIEKISQQMAVEKSKIDTGSAKYSKLCATFKSSALPVASSESSALSESSAPSESSTSCSIILESIFTHDEQYQKFEEVKSTHQTYLSIYTNWQKNVEKEASKTVTDQTKGDFELWKTKFQKQLNDYQTSFSFAKVEFKKHQLSFDSEEQYANKRTAESKHVLQHIDVGYEFLSLSLQSYFTHLEMVETSSLKSFGKVGIEYHNENSIIDMNGIFLKNGEVKHADIDHHNEDIKLRSFNINSFHALSNWVYMTNHEYETEHRTKQLPIGLFCFITNEQLHQITSLHHHDQSNNDGVEGRKITPSYVSLEHCSIAKHTLTTLKERQKLKELSHCYLENLLETNHFYDCRMNKFGEDDKTRSFVSYYPGKGRQDDRFGMFHEKWVYTEDTHGIIITGDFAKERHRHELDHSNSQRNVCSSRTSFHVNFSVPTIPNLNNSIKGEWRYFDYTNIRQDINDLIIGVEE